MKIFRIESAFGAILLVLAGVIVVGVFDAHLHPNAFQEAEEPHQAPSYDLVIDPIALIKNPYKLKGQYGMLDPANKWIDLHDGTWQHYPCFGPCVVFNKVIDDNLATFDVGDEQFAMILQNNEEPDPTKPWIVYVEGTLELTNGLGASGNVATLRFIGYGKMPFEDVPAKPAEQPVPPPPSSIQPAGDGSDVSIGGPDNVEQPAAPIERRPPNADTSAP